VLRADGGAPARAVRRGWWGQGLGDVGAEPLAAPRAGRRGPAASVRRGRVRAQRRRRRFAAPLALRRAARPAPPGRGRGMPRLSRGHGRRRAAAGKAASLRGSRAHASAGPGGGWSVAKGCAARLRPRPLGSCWAQDGRAKVARRAAREERAGGGGVWVRRRGVRPMRFAGARGARAARSGGRGVCVGGRLGAWGGEGGGSGTRGGARASDGARAGAAGSADGCGGGSAARGRGCVCRRACSRVAWAGAG